MTVQRVSSDYLAVIARGRVVLLSLGAAFFLANCATPETRLRTGLIEAGLPSPQAACMAERMADRLSLLQLKRLGSLGALKDKDPNSMTEAEFLHQVRALNDAEILTVSVSSAAVCAFK